MPITTILVFGPETVTLQLDPTELAKQSPVSAEVDEGAKRVAGRGAVKGAPYAPKSWALTAILLTTATAIALLGIMAASDAVLLSSSPEDSCLVQFQRSVSGAAGDDVGSSGGPGRSRGGDVLPSCWATQVYGLPLRFDDLTPNIGQWWYFFTEVGMWDGV